MLKHTTQEMINTINTILPKDSGVLALKTNTVQARELKMADNGIITLACTLSAR
jgi:hypothetical protein